MNKISTNITIDSDIKTEAQKLLIDFGMDLSTAINIFLRQMVRDKAFPFVIRENTPNEVTLAAMDAAENDEDMYGPFDTVEELMEALNA
ncbi:MAG: type II toxin-antitoxin system RelB/DinJ family antitoxin [Clostridia bacterium]|nr:type II toxin-antitoxin system RelB/DinJ family antitoxin [Clostridia bacterium]